MGDVHFLSNLPLPAVCFSAITIVPFSFLSSAICCAKSCVESISSKYNIPLIEDAAEALGTTYKNTKAGKFGIASVHSFHRTKTITTGEGGFLLLDNEKIFV